MLDPRYHKYHTGKMLTTKHGYKYMELKRGTPIKLRNEYMTFVYEQDEKIANGQPVDML